MWLDTDGCEACQAQAERMIDSYSGNRLLACLVAIFELDGWVQKWFRRFEHIAVGEELGNTVGQRTVNWAVEQNRH
jgi:hypothetical protein